MLIRPEILTKPDPGFIGIRVKKFGYNLAHQTYILEYVREHMPYQGYVHCPFRFGIKYISSGYLRKKMTIHNPCIGPYLPIKYRIEYYREYFRSIGLRYKTPKKNK